jgi:hypothetical protein
MDMVITAFKAGMAVPAFFGGMIAAIVLLSTGFAIIGAVATGIGSIVAVVIDVIGRAAGD